MHALKHAYNIKRVYIHKNIRKKKTKKKNKKGSHSKESTLIDWPNSLTIVPSGVANCRNLPFGGRATRDSQDACSTKGLRVESPPTFI